MISQFTWPNFRSGSEKDGVRVIMDENNFADDVKYGKTKLFIRSPKTLFALENARNTLIPGIVTLIQKTWRGTFNVHSLSINGFFSKYFSKLVWTYFFRLCGS